MAPVKIAELKKAVVLVDGEDHWMLLNKNRDSIESIILDQIRLMKRHQRLPIWFGDQVIWIKLESGGEYGLLGFDTELIVEQATEAVQVEEIEMSLIPGLRDGFYWKKSAGLYRIREETVRIQADPQIPEGFLQVPYYLLEHVFALPPKSKINCERVVKTKLEFPHQWTISHSAATNTFNSLNSFDFESIMFVAEGTAVIGSTEARKNIQYKEVKPIQFDELATFLMKKPKIALIEGDAGVGKTIQIQQAIMALNWRHEFPLIIKYYDMLSETPIIGNERFRTLYILDHFDEYFEEQEEAEPENRQKFLKIAKQINHATQTLDHSVAIIVRSCRNLTKYMRGCGMLSFDASFTCETVKNTSMTLIDSPAFDHVLGSQATLLRLKCLLFNPIKYEHIYAANGMKRQGGVLIHGPSGCGKTFIAESFLKGHGIPFIRVRGPELLDKYVGASEAAVRDVFSRARKQRPCVILFDEFDSLVPQRGSNHSGVTDRIVNQFLTELDGTGDRSGVYVLATTSRPELIDKAILRPGRVDARIEMAFPSHEELREVNNDFADLLII